MIADIFAAIAADPRLAAVECELGAEYLDVNSAPPRMVWVPTVGTFTPGQGRRATAAKEPRSVLTRNAGVRIRLWAKADDGDDSTSEVRAVEQLMNLVLTVLRSHAFGAHVVQTEEWLESRAEHLQFGRAVDVSVTFEIPVPLPASPTVTIVDGTAADMTGTLRLPTSDTTDSPSP